MKHNDFFNIVSMLFRDDVAYLGVTDSWKSKVRLSIENYGNRKDTKITLD